MDHSSCRLDRQWRSRTNCWQRFKEEDHRGEDKDPGEKKTLDKDKARTLEENDSFFEADGESSMGVVIDEEKKRRTYAEDDRLRQQKLKEEDRSSKKSAKKTVSMDAEIADKMMEENKILKEQM